jgi:uncharacterized membrane protein YjjP (DUF1212 family)
MSTAPPSFIDRTEFILELARRLHTYGTNSPRLEAALTQASHRLGLRCEVWSNPTGLIVSFGGGLGGEGGPENTRVLRMPPGDVDLRKLCEADAIAERVMAGELDVRAGLAELKALAVPASELTRWRSALSFGLASASVAGLFGGGWSEILSAALIGLLIGMLTVFGSAYPRLAEASDALAAFLASLLAAAIATFIMPLALKPVVISALIVLLPGMMLTVAAAELTSQHLVSGTARFAGAFTVLAKLTFGTIAANELVKLFGWVPLDAALGSAPHWLEWAAVATAGFSFAILFRASYRDYPLVIFAAAMSYAITRFSGIWLGTSPGDFPTGVFVAAIAVTAASNIYARWRNRPGAVIRVPGIILMVPGSAGFRSLSLLMEGDMMVGLDTARALLLVLVALVAGLLFGNLIVPARRSL